MSIMSTSSDPQWLLEELARAPATVMARLRAGDDGAPIVPALILTKDSHLRQLLCDLVGFRRELDGLDALIGCLDDSKPAVRSAAADALAKLADHRAGPALLARATLPEPDLGVLCMLTAALGAVGYVEAAPVLIDWLRAPDPSLRGSAAWSLGALGASDAVPALTAALHVEPAPYPAERMRAALAQITGH